MADKIEKPRLPKLAVAKNALVGDEAVQGAKHEPEFDVNTEPVRAQTTGLPAETVEESYVHETFVALDRVITDPHSPEAVQIPDAGRGSLDLPIHGLARPTVEEVFAAEAAKVEEADNDEPVNPDAEK